MSQFGKKSLNWWNWEGYLTDNKFIEKWNHTPKEIQLQLLKKWYPIGMIGKRLLVGSNAPSSLEVEITGYIEYLWGYQLDVNYIDSNYRTECHSVRFIPELKDRNRILRELRLNKLLN
jgi:hypothetical protein